MELTKTVVLDLDNYDDLKTVEFMFDDIIETFKDIIDNASLSYYGTELMFDEGDLKKIVKKYCKSYYKNKLEKLTEIKEQKAEGNDDLSIQ